MKVFESIFKLNKRPEQELEKDMFLILQSGQMRNYLSAFN